MLNVDRSDWWIFLLRGLIGVIFGILCIVSPLSMSASLVLVWGVFALVDGVIAVFYAVTGKTMFNRWLIGLQGVLGILLGLVALFNPAAAALAILLYIAAWSFVIGGLTIATAIVYRNEMKGEFWLGLAGALTILFGVYVILNPAIAAISLVWVLGFYAVAAGVATIAFAFRLKKHGADVATR